jgi:hypothetical protein
MSDDFFDIGWEEMALAGSLAEEMADEERERRKLEQESEIEESACCCEPCEPPEPTLEPPDEDPYP